LALWRCLSIDHSSFLDIAANRNRRRVALVTRVNLLMSVYFNVVHALVCCSSDMMADCMGRSTARVQRDAAVAEAFLRMFIETCGHYDGYINRQQNGEKIFQVCAFYYFYVTSRMVCVR
jgi:hypothetical protein